MLLSKSDPTDLREKLFVPLSQRDRCKPNCVDFSLDVLRNIICDSKDESSTDRVCWGSTYTLNRVLKVTDKNGELLY